MIALVPQCLVHRAHNVPFSELCEPVTLARSVLETLAEFVTFVVLQVASFYGRDWLLLLLLLLLLSSATFGFGSLATGWWFGRFAADVATAAASAPGSTRPSFNSNSLCVACHCEVLPGMGRHGVIAIQVMFWANDAV